MRAKTFLPCLIALLASTAAYGAEDLEAWVSGPYYEGLPLEGAQDLAAEDIADLAEMLADPGLSASRANTLLALGASGHPNAYRALARYASSAPSGEVDRDEFRARTRLPIAMGHLAQRDRRALRWLMRACVRPHRGRGPSWSFRHHRGERLSALLEEACLTGLALSGQPQARRWLDRASGFDSSDPENADSGDSASERRRRHARSVREVHDRVAGGGPARRRMPHAGEDQ